MFVKIRLILLILFLAAMVAGIFWISKEFQIVFDNNETVDLPSEDSTKPWIEVVSPKVFELDKKSGLVKKEFFTGDELSAGMVIKVDGSGFASIYFPDGSVARIDGGTEFILEESSFNADSGKMVVKINLLLGRVWSKIISLATPDSVWEVKTFTAVATVRGTAFGMEYADGKSTVVGSENKVAVSAVDPKTGKTLKQEEILVEAGKSVEIKKELAEQVASHIARIEAQKQGGVAAIAAPAAISQKFIAVKTAPKEILEKAWVRKSMEADAKINEQVKELKEKKAEIKEVRSEIKKTIREEVKERILEQKEAIREKKEEAKADSAGSPWADSGINKIISNDLIGKYRGYKENPTKENLPEKLPQEIINGLPKEIPERLKSFIPPDVQPKVDLFLKSPDLQNQLQEKWEMIQGQTKISAESIIKDIDATNLVPAQSYEIKK